MSQLPKLKLIRYFTSFELYIVHTIASFVIKTKLLIDNNQVTIDVASPESGIIKEVVDISRIIISLQVYNSAKVPI